MTSIEDRNPSLVFVLGMHRSGTSALARALSLAGMRIPNDVLAANQDNPLGYWEPKSIVDFNQRLLQEFDRHWSDPKPLRIGWAMDAAPGLTPQDAAALLRGEFENAQAQEPTATVVIKDPRLSRTIALWREAAQLCQIDAACIILFRNPFDVFQSLEKRERMTREHALLLWQSYMLEAEAGTRGIRRAVVNYDELINDWRTTLRRALDDIAWPEAASFEENAHLIDAFLDKKHRHHYSGKHQYSDQGQPDADVETAFRLFSQPFTPETDAEFDHLQNLRMDDWAQRSPGDRGSRYPRQLPGWYAEQSRELEARGRLGEAIEAARKAVALAPDVMRFHFILGDLLIKENQLEEGASSLRSAIEIDGTQARVFRLLCNALERLGDTAGAIAAAKETIACGGQIAGDHHKLGVLLIRSRQFEQAVPLLRQAIALDKSKAIYHHALSRALSRLNETEASIEAATRAAELAPGRANFACDLGLLLRKAGRSGDAIAQFKRALELDEKPLRHHTALANALVATGEVEQAIEAFQRVAERDDFHVGLCDQLAELCARTNRWPEAKRMYDKALGFRSQLFGFRSNASNIQPTEGSDPADKTRLQHLRLMLARLGAQHRAEEITRLLCDAQPTPEGEREWPHGNKLPHRQLNAVATSTGNRPETTLSIMIPVYEIEREDWLRAALDAVLAQDRGPNWAEIVVVDDASKSQTAKHVVESYGSRVRYTRNLANLGLVGNHNRCLSEAKGEFVHILHQDDCIKPGFYDALLTPMLRDRSIAAAFCQTGYISDASSTEGSEPAIQSRGILEDWHIKLSIYRIQFPTMIVRRAAYSAVGGFSPSLKFAFDWDMWNRIAASGRVWYDPSPMAQYRVHAASATSSFSMTVRVADAMQVVAHMLKLIPEHQRRATAELAMHKFILRYWTLITQEPHHQHTQDRSDLISLLTSGWTTPEELEQIHELVG